MTFREGDRVRVTNPNPDVVEYTGFVGTVQDTSGVFFPVDVNFGEDAPHGRLPEYAFLESELEMVRPLFQDGDKVRLINDEVVHTFDIGAIGVIQRESPDFDSDSEKKVWTMYVPGSRPQLVYEEHIEGVSAAIGEPQIFREGDKVRLVDDENIHTFGVGAVGTLESMDNPSAWNMKVPGAGDQVVYEQQIEKVLHPPQTTDELIRSWESERAMRRVFEDAAKDHADKVTQLEEELSNLKSQNVERPTYGVVISLRDKIVEFQTGVVSWNYEDDRAIFKTEDGSHTFVMLRDVDYVHVSRRNG